MDKVRYRTRIMTMPIPEFHPESTADLLTACRAIQLCGESVEAEEVVRKFGVFIHGVFRHDVTIADIPFTVSDAMVVFGALSEYVRIGVGQDNSTYIAARALLEEQCHPDIAAERAERLRGTIEHLKDTGDLVDGFVPAVGECVSPIIEDGHAERQLVGRKVRSLAYEVNNSPTGAIPPPCKAGRIHAA